MVCDLWSKLLNLSRLPDLRIIYLDQCRSVYLLNFQKEHSFVTEISRKPRNSKETSQFLILYFKSISQKISHTKKTTKNKLIGIIYLYIMDCSTRRNKKMQNKVFIKINQLNLLLSKNYSQEIMKKMYNLLISGLKSKSTWQSLLIIPAIATYCLIDKYAFSISPSQGQSMEPTIKPGDIIVVDRFFYKMFGGLKKDDIIVAIQPVDPTVSICKRIIQTGGHQVPHKQGIVVPEDFYWIEGDNSRKSYDSRHHGCVPANLIKGKVIFTIPM